MPVFADVVHHELNGLPVVQHQIELFHDLHGLLLQHPLEQRVDVLKVIVEAVAIQAAVLHDLVDRDFGQRFLFISFFSDAASARFVSCEEPVRFMESKILPYFTICITISKANPLVNTIQRLRLLVNFRHLSKNWTKRGELSISSENRLR